MVHDASAVHATYEREACSFVRDGDGWQIALVTEHHASLAAHLERTIRTGTYCAYLPDPQARVEWSIRD